MLFIVSRWHLVNPQSFIWLCICSAYNIYSLIFSLIWTHYPQKLDKQKQCIPQSLAWKCFEFINNISITYNLFQTESRVLPSQIYTLQKWSLWHPVCKALSLRNEAGFYIFLYLFTLWRKCTWSKERATLL